MVWFVCYPATFKKAGLRAAVYPAGLPKNDKRNVVECLAIASTIFGKGDEGRQTHFLASPAVSSSHRSPVEGLRFPLGCSVQEPWGSSPHACRQTPLDASWTALQPQGVIIPVPLGMGLPAGFQTGDLTSK